MKRATAIRHLVEMAVAADDLVDRAKALGAAPLTEMWVTGDLLTPTDALDWGSVVLVLVLPPDQLTWLAHDPAAEWVGAQLRLDKRPMGWSYRPAAWPVWNVRDRRLVRFWADGDGIDDAAIEALRERRLDRLAVVEPSAGEVTAQLTRELAASRSHLRHVLDRFENRDWRRAHTGVDESPAESAGGQHRVGGDTRWWTTEQPARCDHPNARTRSCLIGGWIRIATSRSGAGSVAPAHWSSRRGQTGACLPS